MRHLLSLQKWRLEQETVTKCWRLSDCEKEKANALICTRRRGTLQPVFQPEKTKTLITSKVYKEKGFKSCSAYSGEHAKQRLDMVTRNGVTNESPRLVPHKLQKPKRVKAGQGAVVRLPFPVEKTGVRTAIGDAILVTINDDTT